VKLGAALGRLLRRRRRSGDGHPLTARERERVSDGFFDERAKALGPDAYDHVDVERDFRKP